MEQREDLGLGVERDVGGGEDRVDVGGDRLGRGVASALPPTRDTARRAAETSW